MKFSPPRTPAQSLQEYGRGIAGGLMFSLPLLFTMEVWFAGFMLHPARLALYVVATFGVLLAYNRFAGLRSDASWWECAIDSVEEMGLGLVLSAAILWLLGRLDVADDWLVIMGKIVIEGMTVAIGVSVGTAQLGGGQSDAGMENDESESSAGLSQLAIAFCGAVLFASNVAPTEEILVLAEENSPLKLLLLALVSFLLGSYVLFFAEFRGAQQFARAANMAGLVRGAISTYAVALAASALMLFFFGRLDGETISLCVAQIVVVGLPASLGASAGRLLLQGNAGGGDD
ncbi:MAG: TIGR02587 family membrane protein [Armatimonadetes bacterium]|nr:TIGR02587 family membrane protein [Armatimonadota bacterium]